MRRFQAAEHDAGERVDAALATWTGESRSWAQRQVAGGNVAVDGERAAKSLRLVAGQVIELTELAPDKPSGPPPVVPVRWQDEHLTVVVKPAGLVVHTGSGTGSQPTLVDALRSQGVPLADNGDPDRPGIVHRLDRGTSGVLVVASTDAAYQGLVAAMKAHDIERRYWALVDGHPDPASATIDAPISRDPNHRTRFTVSDDGRRAVSHYDVDATHAGCAELTVRLETGRTHQVRVHMTAVGHPVSGDKAYGASTTVTQTLGLERPALHASHLAFTHPVTGEHVTVDEPLPDDLATARTIAASP